MKTAIFDEMVFGHKLVMWRDKRANGEVWFTVISSIEPLCNGCVCSTQDRKEAYKALKNAAKDIVSYEITRYNSIHGIEMDHNY